MKKYLKMLPLLLYPYIYMLALFGYFFLVMKIDGSARMQSYGLLFLLCFAVVCNLYVLIAVIVMLVRAVKGKYSAKELAKMNFLIKLIQVPAYLIHFLLGCLGVLASVWGIGIVFWAVLIDIITISLTGFNGIGACVQSYREKKVGKGGAILFAIMNFLFCVDVIGSLVLFIKSCHPENVVRV